MAVHYTFDPRQSRFTVQAFASGMLRVFAHNPTLAVRQFAGELTCDPETFANASVRLTVKADSLEVTDELSPKDKQEIQTVTRDQVLEASRYPEIVYACDDVAVSNAVGRSFRVQFKGKLTLHGVTRDHPVDAQVNVVGDTVRLSGTTTVKQADYGIKPVKAAGGMIAAKDEVKVAFDIVGRQQEG
jgi:polyisoprenoid-binding protein YceI